MSKILLVVSAASTDSGYNVNAPIKGLDGQPKMVNGKPVTAKMAAMFMACGLKFPQTKEDMKVALPIMKQNIKGVVTKEYTRDVLYDTGKKHSHFVIKGWEDFKSFRGKDYVSNATLAMNLSKIDEGVFGRDPKDDGNNTWLRIGANLGEHDGSLTEYGMAILADYELQASELGCRRTHSGKEGATFNHCFDSYGLTYEGSDGKTHALFHPSIQLKEGSAFYALIEKKESGRWGTVRVPLLDAKGEQRKNSKGADMYMSGWGFINTTLWVYWGGSELCQTGPSSHNRIV